MSAVAEQRDEREITSVELRSPDARTEQRKCHVCGATFWTRRGGGRAGCELHRYTRQETDDPRARLEDDPRTEKFLDEHVGGASLYEISVVLGISKERVRQIERDALAKLARRTESRGVTAEDVRGMSLPFSRTDQMAKAPRRARYSESLYNQRIRERRAAELAALEEPSEVVQRLTDALDEVIAIGELVSLAARYAAEDP